MASSINEAINRIVEGEEEAAPPPEEDIRIPAPKEPEVNPQVYKDVERLLFRGFLTLSGDVNGVPFLFKSLSHHEFETVQWISGSDLNDERYYTTFLAFGVFMVDGQNILVERDKWLPKIIDMFKGLPVAARTKIVRYLGEVNRRASNAVTLTEAYQMENYSRFRWAQLRGIDMMSTAVSGIPGTNNLGMNFGQLVWRALNYYEDLKEDAEREWDHAKFIGGCFVGGKEIRKIHNQDQERRRKEKEEKIERKDKLIRQVVLGEDPEKESKAGPVKIVARTVEELASQLEKDLRGEKDWHDEIVAREENRIRASIRERQVKLQQLVQSREAESNHRLSSSTEMAGLSREEVQQRILRQRQLQAQQAASRIVYPEMMDERMEGFLSKYMDADDTYQSPGAVRSKVQPTERDPSSAQGLPPARPRGTPFRR